jgi:hypothetical protein
VESRPTLRPREPAGLQGISAESGNNKPCLPCRRSRVRIPSAAFACKWGHFSARCLFPRQLSRPSPLTGELPANLAFQAAPMCVCVLAKSQRFDHVWRLGHCPCYSPPFASSRSDRPDLPSSRVHIRSPSHGGLDGAGQRLFRSLPSARDGLGRLRNDWTILRVAELESGRNGVLCMWVQPGRITLRAPGDVRTYGPGPGDRARRKRLSEPRSPRRHGNSRGAWRRSPPHTHLLARPNSPCAEPLRSSVEASLPRCTDAAHDRTAAIGSGGSARSSWLRDVMPSLLKTLWR